MTKLTAASLRAGWRPDPLPPMPTALPADPADVWWVGVAAGIAQGRRLAALEIEQGHSIRAAGGLWDRPAGQEVKP
ncbi:hypothetical protein KBY85_15350 [Cyanobium sp. BA5m-10]|uniref:hypothetical protein n=1 Tax=Cyanobium sp. BA5m-10 TaxID=2823705 RepID=UPI0020CBAA8E|nr:hypothetical protein [Cyanobium sp. BA5m-10]MCP9905500.1 hypothetical protein [Cyanobium sp. BA5m-10]